jgi:hypothetical protein
MQSRPWIIRVSCVLLLTVTLALPARAQVRDPTLSDAQEPGSVLVFPKFLAGTTPKGQPKSEFVIGITCPKNPHGTLGVCAEGTKVKLEANWVCPGSQDPAQKLICKVTDFNLTSTVFGTIVINPANVGPATQRVPGPSCAAGYLVVSVINTSDQGIKFDGLVGHAVLREVEVDLIAGGQVPGERESGYGLFWFKGDGQGHWQQVPASGLPRQGVAIPHGIALADRDRDGGRAIITLHGGLNGHLTLWTRP